MLKTRVLLIMSIMSITPSKQSAKNPGLVDYVDYWATINSRLPNQAWLDHGVSCLLRGRGSLFLIG